MRCLILLLFLLNIDTNAQQFRKIEVVVLGTFHFGESNDYQSGKLEDLLSNKRQKEIAEVVRKLAKFNPDKIFVENTPEVQDYWDQVFANYKNGLEPNETTASNEIFQLGIKLARFTKNSNGVRCVNYDFPEFEVSDKQNLKPEQLFNAYSHYLKSKTPDHWEFLLTNPLTKDIFTRYMSKNDSWKKLTLREHLLKMNEPSNLQELAYLNVLSYMDRNTNGVGAEISSKLYYRNLQILQNIYLNMSLKDNRMLLIIGAGHAQILKDMMKNHPLFKVIEVADVLN